MSSLPVLPIKTLTPVLDDDDSDKVIKYEYFRNKGEYSHEEVSDLLKQVYNHLHCTAGKREPHRFLSWFRHADWHNTVTRSAPEVCPSHVLCRLLPNAPLPGEEGFDMDEPPTILESYLLQRTIFSGTHLRPGIIANNTDFPGHVLDRFPTPLPDTEEEEEVIVFSDPPAKTAPPTTPARSVASSSTAAPLIPPRSTHPQWTPMSLLPPVVNSPGVSPSPRNHPRPARKPSGSATLEFICSGQTFRFVSSSSYRGDSHPSPTRPPPATPDQMISHGFREMASAFQDLRQALLSPGASTLVSGSGAASSATPNLMSTALPPGNTEPPVDKADLVESSLRFTRRRLQRNLQRRHAPPLPPVTGQGEFLGVHPLSPMHEEAPAPMMPPPPLPVEEPLSIVVEELPPPAEPMEVDEPPSLPRAYHPMTGAPLYSCSLVITSPALDEPSPPTLEPSQAPSKRSNQGKPKGKKGKDKGKGKAPAPIPEPARSPMLPIILPTSAARAEPPLPKKDLKRKRPATQAAASEAGPSQATSSRPTRARSATAKAARIPEVQTDADSERAGPSVKKPRFSPEKVAKRKSSQPIVTAAPEPAPQDSNRMFHGRPKQQFLAAELTQAQDPNVAGIPIDRHNSRVELENYHFKDLITAPDEFFDPVRYGYKNGTYGARSSHYAFYACAPDHYEKTCLPCSARMIECTWNNWFLGATCNQCRDGRRGGCSARYTAHEMHEITSHLTTFMWYNIPSLRCNIMQLRGINCELEHVDFLYRGRVRARDHVVRDITETLDQFASAEGGNKLIEALSGAYHEVRSFIVDDGLRHSVGQPLNLPRGPEYVPSDNDASMWNGSADDESEDNEGGDNEGGDDDEQAAGPSGTQGGDDLGAAGSSK
ncbi:uncharacterized protein ARMOST_10450 [Armillaria ostoyae]|uniref:Uncharacterized protein n=1 Tax=Armillaria ostoyae TaxID=47428 RepID=A0A284REB9_ARMOS|nr:uncharacterized protein ARMOST_10450 [Armillaria ostoyae]